MLTLALIFNELNEKKGNGGLIAVDKDGNIAMTFNSGGMFRGYLYKEQGKTSVKKGVGIGKLMSKFTNTHIRAAVQLIYLIPNFALSSLCKASLCTII